MNYTNFLNTEKVPFLTAKALKKIGFNDSCSTVARQITYEGKTKYAISPPIIGKFTKNEELKENFFTVPTYMQMFKWVIDNEKKLGVDKYSYRKPLK